MPSFLSTAFLAAPLAVAGSYANIYGICNYYKEAVSFTNTECSGNNCVANGNGGNCDARRAFIPQCDSPGDFSAHHMTVKSSDDEVNFVFWKDDSTGYIMQGTDDYGSGSQLIKIPPGPQGEWNVVIQLDGSFNLYPTALWNHCPPKQNPHRIGTPNAKWLNVGSNNGGSIELSVSFGVTTTEEHLKTNTFATAFTVKTAEGAVFDQVAMSLTVSDSVATTVSEAIAHSTEKTFTATCPVKKGFPQIFLFQYAVEAVVDTLESYSVSSRHYYCSYTKFGMREPKCPLGFCGDEQCQTCLPGWKNTTLPTHQKLTHQNLTLSQSV